MLEWQRQNIMSRQKDQHDLKEYEKAKLHEKWSKELIQEKQKKQKEREEMLDQFHDIEEFNKTEMEARKAQLDQEKLNDKELVKKILDKEKALDEIDRKEKVIYFLKNYFLILNLKK
jgi:D-mannonate dehydratase